jgi:hypothetical protein
MRIFSHFVSNDPKSKLIRSQPLNSAGEKIVALIMPIYERRSKIRVQNNQSNDRK